MNFESVMTNIVGTTLFRHIHSDTICSPFSSGELKRDGLILQDKRSHHYFMLGGKTLVKLLQAFKVEGADDLGKLGASLRRALNESLVYAFNELSISSVNSVAELELELIDDYDYAVFEWDFTGVDCFVSPALMLQTWGIPGGISGLKGHSAKSFAAGDPRNAYGPHIGGTVPYMTMEHYPHMMLFPYRANIARMNSYGTPSNIYFGPEAIPDGVAYTRMGFMTTYAEGDKTWQDIYDANYDAVEHKGESEVQSRLETATKAFWQLAGSPTETIAHPLTLVPRANDGWMFHQQVYTGCPTINKTTLRDLIELTPAAAKDLTAVRKLEDYQVSPEIANDVQVAVEDGLQAPAIKEAFARKVGGNASIEGGRVLPSFYLLGSTRLLIPIVLPRCQIGYQTQDSKMFSIPEGVMTPYGAAYSVNTFRAFVTDDHTPRLFLYGSNHYQPAQQIVSTIDGIDGQPLAKIFGTGSRVEVVRVMDGVAVDYAEPSNSAESTSLKLFGYGRLRETYSSKEYIVESDENGKLTDSALYSNELVGQSSYNPCFPMGISPLDYAMPNMRKVVNVFWFAMDKYGGFTDTHADIMSGGKVRGSGRFIAYSWGLKPGDRHFTLTFEPGRARDTIDRIKEWATHMKGDEVPDELFNTRYPLWGPLPKIGRSAP